MAREPQPSDAVSVRGGAIGSSRRPPASQKQNMRAPFITSLFAAICVVGAGCTSAPQQDPPLASHGRDCGNAAYDPLHMVSSKSPATRDPDTESLLSQSADPRLAWVNRQMYLSLRSLDIELRREQRVAECERSQSTQMFEARAGGAAAGDAAGSGAAVGGGTTLVAIGGAAGVAAGSAANGGAGTLPPAAASAAPRSSMASSTAAGAGRSTLVRKSSLSAAGAGGNGATAQKVVAGSDNDIVARRLRKAAEQETDPALRAKLFKEYADYRQGMSVR